MDLQNIAKNTASASVEFLGETLKFRYRPAAITTETFSKVQNTEDEDEFITLFCQIVADWDMTSNGEPVPVNKTVLRNLPVQLLRVIMGAIMDDGPKKASEEGKASGSFS